MQETNIITDTKPLIEYICRGCGCKQRKILEEIVDLDKRCKPCFTIHKQSNRVKHLADHKTFDSLEKDKKKIKEPKIAIDKTVIWSCVSCSSTYEFDKKPFKCTKCSSKALIKKYIGNVHENM